MWDTEEDYEENEETPPEYDYENPEHPDEKPIDLADLPPIEGAEFIAKIEDPEVRQREVEAAERIYEKGEELKRKLESGEISQGAYEHERSLHGIKARRAITRWELADRMHKEGMSKEAHDIITRQVEQVRKRKK